MSSTPKLVPVEQVYRNFLGQDLTPGDKVITFSANHSGTKISSGIYLGVKLETFMELGERVTGLIIQRESRKTIINHCKAVLFTTSLSELDGHSL
jgi:hypothetical protein